MKKLLLILFFLSIISSIFSQSLTVSPGWSVTIPASTIIEAGLNYTTTTVTSGASQSTMSITTNSNNVNVFVYVQKTDVTWDSNLTLWVRRSGNGTGAGNSSITNGTTFQQITNTPIQFFTVYMGKSRTYSSIPIQYQISGISVIIPAQTYTTTLLFTITY